ncbi:signal peptidase I [Citricoccus sp. GCM10030269]|uniref:signal peptidase I n=1 Tax=Citricoccus sp. GCM10030269 TaxID=3273388 RepID=UPI003623A004
MCRTAAYRATGRSIARRLVDVAWVASLLVALGLLVPGFFGIERYVITGGSMSGAFEPGAVVFERNVPVQDLSVGDVITYQPPLDSGVQNLVTHRITEVETHPEQGRLFTTKGDANAAADPWQFTIDAATQPTVVLAVDHLGWPLIWLADPTHRMLLIGVPAVMIFLIAARELTAALREPRALKPTSVQA